MNKHLRWILLGELAIVMCLAAGGAGAIGTLAYSLFEPISHVLDQVLSYH